jgi:hypothetical protein
MNNIVAFPAVTPARNGDWQPAELQQLVALFAAHAGSGAVTCWDIGKTEAGDPQFYLLGPAPDFDCLLCCSRVDALYVLEDGDGFLVAEEQSLRTMMSKAVKAVVGRRRSAMARMLVVFATFRITIEQKLEPMLAEASEWLFRFAPQLAALA